MYFWINIVFNILLFVYAFSIERRLNNKHKAVVFYLLSIIYILILTYRPLDTPDTLNYVEGFNSVEAGHFFRGNILHKYYGYEIGYIFLIKCFKLISNSFRLFFMMIASIGVYCTIDAMSYLFRQLYNTNDWIKTQLFALYSACFGLLYNGISVRAGLAMGLGLMFVVKALDKKYIQAVLFIAAAVFIQRTSFLMLLVYLAISLVPVLQKKTHIIIWISIGILLLSGLSHYISSPINELLIKIFTTYNISGINYLVDQESLYGATDIFMWLLYGFFIIINPGLECYEKYLNVIMFGALIVLTMFGVRAISRAWDMFYLLMVPMLCLLYHRKSSVIKHLYIQQIFVLVIVVIKSYKMMSIVFGNL